jgi:hypothetical protein
MNERYMNSAGSLKRQAGNRADELHAQASAYVDSLTSIDTAALTTFTLIICVLIYFQYFQKRTFSTTGITLFLIGFGSLLLLHSAAGFLTPGDTAFRVLGNIGNIVSSGLLVAALFVEMTVTKAARAQGQGGGGPPPPQF